jgi:uncharacterized protein YdeI (YjbR/CyaY-like superfamily)
VTADRNAGRPAGEIVHFATAAELETWFESNHGLEEGIWLKIAKKGADRPSVTYGEAVDLALCFGWIDGQKASFDGEYWLQRFTRRGRRSRWSQLNRARAESLRDAGRMRAPGLAEMERAQADGRWEAAYAGAASATVPEDLQRELDLDPDAAAAFGRLDAQSRYSIIWRINDAKRPETRARRVAQYLEAIRRGERIR